MQLKFNNLQTFVHPFHLGTEPKYFILQASRNVLVGSFRFYYLGFRHDRFSRIII
jgi:hypothetical protein